MLLLHTTVYYQLSLTAVCVVQKHKKQAWCCGCDLFGYAEHAMPSTPSQDLNGWEQFPLPPMHVHSGFVQWRHIQVTAVLTTGSIHG